MTEEARAPRVAFRPARVSRTYDVIVAQVRDEITQGRLRPGDRLPPAFVLAEEFGVSRNAVLEALRMLERSGLVSLRRGSRGGAFIRALNGEELTEPLHLMMETEVPVNDMVEIRRVVEGSTAAWAAERASDAELEAIEEVVTLWEELAADPSPEQWQRALAEDVRFHTMVADASHNAAASAFVRGFLGSLNRMLTEFPRETMMAASEPLRWVFEPIAAHDPEAARLRMQKHIGDFSREAIAALPEGPPPRPQA
jgi:GntR family transcriptional regulator, transcriptional repressor for pyruvate dehydrogenase complex